MKNTKNIKAASMGAAFNTQINTKAILMMLMAGSCLSMSFCFAMVEPDVAMMVEPELARPAALLDHPAIMVTEEMAGRIALASAGGPISQDTLEGLYRASKVEISQDLLNQGRYDRTGEFVAQLVATPEQRIQYVLNLEAGGSVDMTLLKSQRNRLGRVIEHKMEEIQALPDRASLTVTGVIGDDYAAVSDLAIFGEHRFGVTAEYAEAQMEFVAHPDTQWIEQLGSDGTVGSMEVEVQIENWGGEKSARVVNSVLENLRDTIAEIAVRQDVLTEPQTLEWTIRPPVGYFFLNPEHAARPHIARKAFSYIHRNVSYEVLNWLYNNVNITHNGRDEFTVRLVVPVTPISDLVAAA